MLARAAWDQQRFFRHREFEMSFSQMKIDQISQSDHLRLLDFIRDCYVIREFEPLENFSGRLVGQLSSLIPSLHVSYAETCPDLSEFFNAGSTPEIATPEVGRLLEEHMIEHSPLVYYMRTGDGRAARISDYVSQSRYHDTGLYSDFYRHYDIEDDLCLGIATEPSRSIGIAWHSDRLFTDRERSLANLVRPHIVQAWKNARLFSEMIGQLQFLERGLEGASQGLIACDSEGRVRCITALARKYLMEYFETSKKLDRQIPEPLLSWVRCQSAQLNQNDPPPAQMPLVVEREESQLTVRLLSSAGGILLLLKEKNPARLAATLEEHCLSRRESDVLAWASQGKTNGEIAAILAISLPTVKKHMEHILHKLGVETRTAAAAAALQFLSRA
jgi:DNA-binding CsgD family transcriptional regulator